MAAPPPKSAGGSGFLTNKVGPLPMWGWLAILAVGIYIYRKNQAGSSTASGTSAQDQAALLAAEAAANQVSLSTAGGTYSGPSGGAPSSITDPGSTPGSPTTPTSGGGAGPFVPPTNQQWAGAGFGYPSGAGTVTSASGQQYAEVLPGGATAGQQYYYEQTPGTFQAIPIGTNRVGAPYFVPVSSSA